MARGGQRTYKQLIKQSIMVFNVHTCTVVTGKRPRVRPLMTRTESSWVTNWVYRLSLVTKNKQDSVLMTRTESSWFTNWVDQLSLVTKNKQECMVNGAVF